MHWIRLRITPDHTLLDALAVLNQGICQLALVVNDENRLVGTIADGDVRRALLAGQDLNSRVKDAMNREPVVVRLEEGRGTALLRLREHKLRYIPVLDANNKLHELWSLEELLHFTAYPTPVVLMAGGLGSRLAPLTDEVPKPMLPVGGQPLLELILEHFQRQGFRQFYISVNYKAQCITDYFGDGSRLGLSISYIHETIPLGTAGALSLLPQPPTQPCIVMNSDILTRLNFVTLLQTHTARRAPATMVVKKHAVQIPYGVVQQDVRGNMIGIEEKPQHFFPISAGINVLSPEAFAYIPHQTFFDMPDLFQALLQAQHQPAVYEMQEYWLDIGRINDYRRANEEFPFYQQLFVS